MKELARMRHAQKRNSLSKQQVAEKSGKVAEAFLQLPEVQKAKTMLLYVGVGNEVQTAALIERLLAQGKHVAVPLTDFKSKRIILSEIRGLHDLEEKGSGLLEPKKKPVKPLLAGELDLIVVPGIAFDMQGSRLGTGYGFYDKLLRRTSSKIPLVGFCFAENLEERLPAESHDVKMNIIITDKEVIRCRE